MGLDTTHGCWRGSYILFNHWRDHLALAAGYEIKESRDEFGVPLKLAVLPWETFEARNYYGEGWDARPEIEDPLIYLLVHSDCEGVIHPAQGRHVAARLEQLLPRLDEATTDRGNWMMPATQRFIAGLRAAAAANEDVVFE